MPADELRRALGHRIDVERQGDVPHLAALDRGRRAAVEDPIEIAAPGAREARMPVVGDRLDLKHRNRGGPNQRIQALAQPVRGQRLGDIDVRRHPERVHPGIGPPGAMDRDGFAGHLADRLLERLLDGIAQRLPLPADERPAVIFQDQLPARH